MSEEFGTGAEVSYGHFDTRAKMSCMGPNCSGPEVSEYHVLLRKLAMKKITQTCAIKYYAQMMHVRLEIDDHSQPLHDIILKSNEN